MDKKILEDYIDACAFIKDTEAEIARLEKKKRYVQDKVRGSNPDWPYEDRSFNIGGTTETVQDSAALAKERQILDEQRKIAMDLKLGVEGDPLPDAADHQVQVLQPAELGRGGDADGEEVYREWHKKRI